MKGLTKSIFILLSLLLAANTMKAEGLKVVHPAFSPGMVGNLVWLDINQDGFQDTNEPGFPGLEIVISDQNGQALDKTITNAQGNYIFRNLDTVPIPKSYRLFFKLPGGYGFSPNSGLMNDPANSDVSPGTWHTNMFTILPGQGSMDIDAGIIALPLEILPLHRLELHTSVNREMVNLKWIAENELNTHLFFIQKSIDGINYSTIGSESISGQINTPTEYFFSDDMQGTADLTVYYRIMARDNENRAAYSNICKLRFNNQRGINVWPTLFDEAIRINYYSSTAGQITVDICDNAGRIVWENNFTVSRGYNQLSATNLDLLTPGIYYFNLREKTANRNFQQKLIKQY